MQPTLWPNDDSLEIALLAWDVALRLCPGAFGSVQPCTAYHRVAPLLRRLGLRSEPADQAEFFEQALDPAMAGSAARVLVSGAVDEGMPKLVVQIAAKHGVELDMTVLDRCRTPLVLIEAYAKASGIPLQTVQSDILDYSPARPFEVIVTHSFVQHFGPEDRPRLFLAWRRLLGRGGLLVTVARIRSEAEAQRPQGHGMAFRDLAAVVRERLARRPERKRIDPAELDAALESYCTIRARYPVRSLEALVEEVTAAPFRMRRAEIARPPARAAGILGPSLPSGSDYAAIVAEAI